MATLKVSLEMKNHLLCIRYIQFPAQTHINDERDSNAKFRIVHHIKNVVRVWISMIFLLYLSASNNDYTACIKGCRRLFNIYPPEFTPYGGGLVQSLVLQLYSFATGIQFFDGNGCLR